MEYKTIRLENMSYQAYKVSVNLKLVDKVDFIALWDQIFEETKVAKKKKLIIILDLKITRIGTKIIRHLIITL